MVFNVKNLPSLPNSDFMLDLTFNIENFLSILDPIPRIIAVMNSFHPLINLTDMCFQYICTQLSDIQTAGMLLHFIMTVGIHPYGCTVRDIMDNMRNNVIQIRTEDVVTTDLVCWMLCSEAYKRPSTTDVLR